MRALIVDDSRFIREYLRGMLEMMSFRCEQAENGVEALAKLDQAEQFDLMFCDVNMPLMNGLECVRCLRVDGRYSGMRVLMVTTEMDYELIETALAYGADEFLMKPFTSDGLRDKLLLMGIGGHYAAEPQEHGGARAIGQEGSKGV